MRSRALCVASLFLCLSLAVGCGDDEANIPDAGGATDAAPPDAEPGATLDDICNATDGLFLDLFNSMFDCIPWIEIIFGELPSDADLNAACTGFLGPFVEDGTIVLGDAAAYQRCVDFIADVDCYSANLDAPNPCDDLVQGTLAEGADCDGHDQCAGVSYCDKSGDGDCGACAPRKPDHANCFENDECIGRRCTGVNGDIPGMCRHFGEVGDDCIEDDDCAGQLVCNATADKCQTPRVWAEGEACDSFEEDCGLPFSDFYCNVSLEECVPFLQVGDDCAGIGLCRWVHYEICDTLGTGKCLAPTLVGLGNTCAFSTGRKCSSSLRCTNPSDDPPPGVCEPLPEVGDNCRDSDDCGILMSCVDDECQYGEHTGQCPPS